MYGGAHFVQTTNIGQLNTQAVSIDAYCLNSESNELISSLYVIWASGRFNPANGTITSN